MIRLAAFEVPGVQRIGRGGPAWRAWIAGPSLRIRMREGRVDVRLWIVARPGQALGPLARDVRVAVAAAVERLLGLEVGAIAVVVDGVGG
jgi:uncharacterized alkaline shock family protein YloU